ncbi:MAG: hypothetical protein K2N71_08430 [Oscillospiraceae bacterium]|nr:hypothetical protein [Oscillospiraceae bacterium]
MPDNNTVERAEQRVREMDRLTRQFSEQGNRYMQQMMNRRTQTRMQNTQYTDRTYSDVPEDRNSLHNIPQVGKNGTRFEPVERKRDVPPKETAEAPKSAEKTFRQNNTQNAGGQHSANQGIDGEKLLLAALMYLLIMENADIKLILAIAYLIL